MVIPLMSFFGGYFSLIGLNLSNHRLSWLSRTTYGLVFMSYFFLRELSNINRFSQDVGVYTILLVVVIDICLSI